MVNARSQIQWSAISERGIVPNEPSRVGWGFNFEMEDLFAKCMGAQLLAPVLRSGLSARSPQSLARRLSRRFGGEFVPLDHTAERRAGANRALLVSAMTPSGLRIVKAIPNWRHEFDLVVAYVIDSFGEYWPDECVTRFDAMYTPIPECCAPLAKRFGIPVHALPMACDAVRSLAARRTRTVDVLAYGRVPPSFATILDSHYLAPASDHFYLPGIAHPRGDWRGQRSQFWDVLQRTRISLAFAPGQEAPRFRGLPVVNARWFEGLGAGCMMVGRGPLAPGFRKWFFWEDAVVELPPRPEDAPPFIDALLGQPERLDRAHDRNTLMMATNHDWRLRFCDLLEAVGAEPPTGLCRELEVLQSHSGSGTVCSDQG